MVGAGVYVDDIEPVIAAMETAAKREMWKDFYRLGFALAMILAVAQLICYRLSKYFKRQLDLFLHFFKEAETGGKPIATEQTFLREFQLLGQSANRMLEERTKAEEDLRKSEERFHSLFSNMAEGVAMHELIMDEPGKPVNYRIVDVNPQYERMLGLRRTQVIGKSAIEAYDTREAPYLDEYSKVALSGVPSQLETHFAPLDKHFDISIAPWGDGGFATIFSDVTSRKRAEEEHLKLEGQLMQIRKLESIGQLAGGVAHDFNNMLAPILGYAEMLLMGLPDDSSRRTDLEQIIKAAERARDLTRQLLAFARKQTLQMTPLDLNQVIVGFEKMLRRTIREDITIETHLFPQIGSIEGDVGQIEQIILNLAINAQDAMPDGGTLLIETAEVILDEAYAKTHEGVIPAAYVMVMMSDTGAGMDEEILDKIFDPFFTTKELGRGTGLGLSTVYGIVKQHGGHIWVYSEAKEGTTFRIYFPRSEKHREREVPIVPEDTAHGTETILVVEDQEQVRNMACQMLRRYGYRVFEAAEGKTALEIAASLEKPIDLLVTDVVMAGMNGQELYQRLSAVQKQVRVLYMSGYTTNVISHHGVLDSSIHFIQKPFSVKDFIGKVRQVLDEADMERIS
jgi:two-component system, cell cycle sensor histidine kinase and response regulator CckA